MKCETLAPTNSIAEAFLHAATQAPQPMQVAASNARSASALGTGMALASCGAPVFTEMNAPACTTRSNALRSTIRSLTTGKAFARHGSIQISAPSRKLRMCSWQVVVPDCGPCGSPSIIRLQEPQMPSRQSWSKTTGSSPFLISCSLSTSSISRNDMSGDTPSSS